MKIAVVASEAAPFVKTGGLGDVMQALPLALSQQKNTYVSLFIPFVHADQTNGGKMILKGAQIPLGIRIQPLI